MKMIRYVGFDKDGTLMDVMESYAKEWGKILHEEFKIDEKEASDFFLKTAGQATAAQLDTILSNNNINLSDKKIFRKSNQVATLLGERVDVKLFPEVKKILKKLKEQGYFIFVSSGQQEKIVKKDLEKTGIISYIDFYAGVKSEDPDYKKGKPHFKAVAEYFGVPFETFVKETVFIGDTQTDVQVSRESNIICIIRKGANFDERLFGEGVRLIIDDFSNFPEIISKLKI